MTEESYSAQAVKTADRAIIPLYWVIAYVPELPEADRRTLDAARMILHRIAGTKDAQPYFKEES